VCEVEPAVSGMTGLGLYQRLSTSEKPIPTIFIEAYPDDGVRERALSAGVIGYLSKPFEDDDLLACVRSALMDIRGGGR
jgi:CheY-like chemotaxis protein